MFFGEMMGQGARQFADLGCAFLLSAAIGLEREIRHKSAGLRIYTVADLTGRPPRTVAEFVQEHASIFRG